MNPRLRDYFSTTFSFAIIHFTFIQKAQQMQQQSLPFQNVECASIPSLISLRSMVEARLLQAF